MWDIFIPSRNPNTKYTLSGVACVFLFVLKTNIEVISYFFVFAHIDEKNRFTLFCLCFTSLISYLIDIYFQLLSIICLQNEQWRPNATGFACICFVVRERVRTPGISKMLAIASKTTISPKFSIRRKRIWEYRCCFVLCTLSRRRMLRLYYAGLVWYKQINIEREENNVLTYDNMRTMMC